MAQVERAEVPSGLLETKLFPEHGIFGLEKRIQSLPPEEREIANRILSVQNLVGRIVPPETMYQYIEGQFGSVEAVLEQPIVRVINNPMRFVARFTELRARRPQMTPNGNRENQIEGAISEKLKDDKFATPDVTTPANTFGRIKGSFSEAAVNLAMFDLYHPMVIFKEPHPLRFKKEWVVDYIRTVSKAWKAANLENPDAKYRCVVWHALGKGGASMTHGHLQAPMTAGADYAANMWMRRDAEAYRQQWGAGFWEDYIRLHEALGLMIKRNGVYVLAHVAPVKEKEVWIIGKKFDEELGGEIFDLLDCYISRLGVRSFTAAVHLPPIGREEDPDLPVIFRIIDRGDPTNSTNDMGGMEVFMDESVVDMDPYTLKRILAEHWGEAA